MHQVHGVPLDQSQEVGQFDLAGDLGRHVPDHFRLAPTDVLPIEEPRILDRQGGAPWPGRCSGRWRRRGPPGGEIG